MTQYDVNIERLESTIKRLHRENEKLQSIINEQKEEIIQLKEKMADFHKRTFDGFVDDTDRPLLGDLSND